MDSNAFLLSFGMKPGTFDYAEGSIESDDGLVHEAWGSGNRQGLAKNEYGVAPSDAKIEAGNDVAKP